MLLTELAYPAAWRDEAAAVAGAIKRYDRCIVCGRAPLDGGALAKAAEHLEAPELLQLKRVYGAQAARRFPPVPQLRSRGAAKTEDETEFLI